MTRNEIMEQVNELLANEFEVEVSEITPESNIKETLSLDSLSLVDMIALVQVNYKVNIPASDLPKIQTFNDLYDYIESHLPA
ncbi:MAG: acyl carrier protein [Bacteroidaceae bacterium]|jgi:acyl carrier protein|nr:acyl carrier protein [Bacteroidaceae bacterium]MBQ8937422.1 acyl carrier protein [Bacteroidaceae bacterium]MBR0243173.1 acyl carrier protein [Bacteroidaceae bacterium]MBR1791536.1 acyl carrier protein [Bacteroidaceae bacterium]